MKTVFKLAFRNFVAYRRLFIQLTVAFVALIFLITLVCCFTLSINEMQNKILNGNISLNYTWGDKQIEQGAISQQFQTQVYEQWDLKEYIEEICEYEIDYVMEYLTGLILDGQNYPFTSTNYRHFDAYATDEWNVFTSNDYKEAGKNAQFMVGRFPENANEIVVSQRYLEGCGLSADVLGSKICLAVVKYKKPIDDTEGDNDKEMLSPPDWDVSTGWDSSEGDLSEWVEPPKPEIEAVIPMSDELTICGVLLDRYYELNGHWYGCFSPTLLLDKSNSALSNGTTSTLYMCSFDGWATKETADYIEQEDLRYLGDSSLNRINVTANLKMVVNRLALYFGSALVLGIIISAFLLVEKLCAASVKNSGIMSICGFTDKQTFLVLLVQVLFVCIIALIIAMLLTYAAMTVINDILFDTYWIFFKVSTAVYFVVVLIGLAIVAALSVATLGYVTVKRRGKQTRELLDT